MNRQFIKSDQVVERRVRDEHILVPMNSSPACLDCLYTLNETAGYIWRRATEGLAEEQIVSALAAEYGIETAAAADDTRRVLGELVALGALTPATGNG